MGEPALGLVCFVAQRREDALIPILLFLTTYGRQEIWLQDHENEIIVPVLH